MLENLSTPVSTILWVNVSIMTDCLMSLRCISTNMTRKTLLLNDKDIICYIVMWVEDRSHAGWL